MLRCLLGLVTALAVGDTPIVAPCAMSLPFPTLAKTQLGKACDQRAVQLGQLPMTQGLAQKYKQIPPSAFHPGEERSQIWKLGQLHGPYARKATKESRQGVKTASQSRERDWSR